MALPTRLRVDATTSTSPWASRAMSWAVMLSSSPTIDSMLPVLCTLTSLPKSTVARPALTRFTVSDASRSMVLTEAVASSIATRFTSPSDWMDMPEENDSIAPPVCTCRLEVFRSTPPPILAAKPCPTSSATPSPTASSAPSTKDSAPAPPLFMMTSPVFRSRASLIATDAPPLAESVTSVVEVTMLDAEFSVTSCVMTVTLSPTSASKLLPMLAVTESAVTLARPFAKASIWLLATTFKSVVAAVIDDEDVTVVTSACRAISSAALSSALLNASKVSSGDVRPILLPA